ncbi:fumarylacetoacetate hydrolase family protein [Candidatus Latescibacterota bacterium]
MRLVQFLDPESRNQHVGLVEGDEVVDLSQPPGAPTTLYGVYYDAGGDRDGLEVALERVRAAAASSRRIPLPELLAGRPGTAGPHLVKPICGPAGNPHAMRIWLAGVTHADSARLREIEAKQATGDQVNVYELKYRETASGGRPELFPKGDPDAVVGHSQAITRPADTERLVPETELVSLYAVDARGQLDRLGYTGGNDATDNGIEAANPLNLPQAKNWDGGCASLGPVVVTDSEFDDREVSVSCQVCRDGQRVGYKEGKTGQSHLNMPDGLNHMERMLFSRLPLRHGQVQALYWGTPIVFAEADLTEGLLVGDVVSMSFSGGIGTLETPVAALEDSEQYASLRS